MNGAVNSQMRAQTTHENMHIFCFVVGTTPLVHVNKTACEQVVAIFEIIANVMPSVTYSVSETVWKSFIRRKTENEWKNLVNEIFRFCLGIQWENCVCVWFLHQIKTYVCLEKQILESSKYQQQYWTCPNIGIYDYANAWQWTMQLERHIFHISHISSCLLLDNHVQTRVYSEASHYSSSRQQPKPCVVQTLERFAFLMTTMIANCRASALSSEQLLRAVENCRNWMANGMIVCWHALRKRGNFLPHLFRHVEEAILASLVSNTKRKCTQSSAMKWPGKSMSKTIMATSLQLEVTQLFQYPKMIRINRSPTSDTCHQLCRQL